MRSYRAAEQKEKACATLHDAFLLAFTKSVSLSSANPVSAAISEVRHTFSGTSRSIGCCVSIGLGPSFHSEFQEDVVDEDDRGWSGRAFKQEITDNLIGLSAISRSMIGQSYCRFDVNEFIEGLLEGDRYKILKPISGKQRWGEMKILERLSERYMDQEKHIRSLEWCVGKLKIVPRSSRIVDDNGDADDVKLALSLIPSKGKMYAHY